MKNEMNMKYFGIVISNYNLVSTQKANKRCLAKYQPDLCSALDTSNEII